MKQENIIALTPNAELFLDMILICTVPAFVEIIRDMPESPEAMAAAGFLERMPTIAGVILDALGMREKPTEGELLPRQANSRLLELVQTETRGELIKLLNYTVIKREVKE
jgi:hypothetical protein